MKGVNMCVKNLVSFFKRLFKKEKAYVETPTTEEQPKEFVDDLKLEYDFPEKEENIEDSDEEAEYDDSIEDYGNEEEYDSGRLYTFGIDPNKKYIFAPGYGINTKYKYFKLSTSAAYGDFIPWYDESNDPVVCNFIDLYIRIKYNGVKKVEFCDKYLNGIGELMPPNEDTDKLYAIINIDKIISVATCKELDHYPEYKEETEENVIIDKVHKLDFSIPFEMEDGSIYNLDAFCIFGNDIK
jgi:hypothetical protein